MSSSKVTPLSTLTFTASDEYETDALAAHIAARLRPGDVLALEGPMGAGKTRLVRGLVKAFGGDLRNVSSPTYILLNVYPTPTLTVYHLDAYRVGGDDERLHVEGNRVVFPHERPDLQLYSEWDEFDRAEDAWGRGRRPRRRGRGGGTEGGRERRGDRHFPANLHLG